MTDDIYLWIIAGLGTTTLAFLVLAAYYRRKARNWSDNARAWRIAHAKATSVPAPKLTVPTSASPRGYSGGKR